MAKKRPNGRFRFSATVIEWRGPAPFYYAPLPADLATAIDGLKALVSYGWGVIPVEATVGKVTFNTSLFPKNGTYLLPLKNAVRQPMRITVGDLIAVDMTVQSPSLGREPRTA